MKQENQNRTHIFSGSTFEELAGYSRAVVVGDHIYVSGTVGINFQTGKLPEDAAGQAEQALDTIEKALHQAQSGLHDVVRVRVFLTSPDHRGATGPFFFVTSFDLVYVGEEEIEVAAGVFQARHFQVTGTAGNLPQEHPPYDVWCTADDDYLLLRASAEGYMQTHYELTDVVIEETP